MIVTIEPKNRSLVGRPALAGERTRPTSATNSKPNALHDGADLPGHKLIVAVAEVLGFRMGA